MQYDSKTQNENSCNYKISGCPKDLNYRIKNTTAIKNIGTLGVLRDYSEKLVLYITRGSSTKKEEQISNVQVCVARIAATFFFCCVHRPRNNFILRSSVVASHSCWMYDQLYNKLCSHTNCLKMEFAPMHASGPVLNEFIY